MHIRFLGGFFVFFVFFKKKGGGGFKCENEDETEGRES